MRTSATAHVEARKALVDFASVARELEASYDPRGAALTRYREELVKIANAQAAGAIGADRAALYRQGALGEGLRAFPLVAPETDAQRRARDDAQARADFIAQQIEGQQSSIAIAQRELELVGTNDRYRSAEIDKLNLILDLKRRGIDPVSAEAQLLIGNLELLDATNEKVRLAQDRSRELRQLGENAIDRLFDVNSAEDWGDRVLGILGDIGEEFLRLALINPLKNELFGSGLSTLGGGGGLGFLGDIFGGLLSIFGLASGTEYARGGMALVGEHGPETVMMPRGARVLTAPETRRRLGGESKGDGPPPIYLTLNANFAGGAATKQDVEDMGQAAATAAYQAVIEREKRRP
ncbi:MAG: hypothetical protein C0500_15160 [Sphingobium sp.]|nr:hypothetical protein [Sphingobium sp.]